MIKRSLVFTNPAYLYTKHDQLKVKLSESEEERSIPIEDIGLVLLENRQITITTALVSKLLQNKAVVVSCDEQHLPCGIMLPMEGHTTQQKRIREQIQASLPLKKNLWQQTVSAKIANQAALLNLRGKEMENMVYWSKEVTSGDSKNHEARAAAYYWANLFDLEGFTRFRKGPGPNILLNYGYAILRAFTARAIVSSGLLPALGIHHKNQYNAFCLADDIMEPYRPFVDVLVCEIIDSNPGINELTTELKKHLLSLPTMDVSIDGKQRPLATALSTTTNRLYECFAGLRRNLLYPQIVANELPF